MAATVLLAVSDEDQRIIHSLGLQKGGFLTIVAREGDEARRLAAELRPDALVVALDIAGPDGAEVIRSLKSEPSTAGIQTVLIGGKPDRGSEAVQRCGCDAYYPKPVSPRFLAHSVRELLSGARALPLARAS